MFTRKLGRSGIEVSAMGLGCWAIGGRLYGEVDDSESIRALHCALDMGVNFLDTAEGYGEDGHSESVIGKALQGRRDKVFIATKFGGQRTELDDIRGACEASIKRLRTDYVDLYQCRGGPVHVENRNEIRQAL